MDLLFGTYVCPPHEPDSFGIKESFPKNYAGQLLQPLLPQKSAQKATGANGSDAANT